MIKTFLYPFKFLYKYNSILIQTSLNDIRGRFAGSALGLAWVFLYPILFLGAYSTVYLFIFKIKFPDLGSFEYILFIFSGLLPFIGFTEALGTGTPSVISNSNLIKNTLFPIDLIPVKASLTTQVTSVVGILLLTIILLFMGKLSWYFFLLFPTWILQMMFTAGVIWILSGLNVFFRDLQNIVGLLTFILMMVSPIAYRTDMVPENLQPLLRLNPLYYMITSYQHIFIFKKMPPTEVVVIFIALCFFTFLVGFYFFQKIKEVLIDNV